jgi:hypothetical protein
VVLISRLLGSIDEVVEVFNVGEKGSLVCLFWFGFFAKITGGAVVEETFFFC